MGDTSRPGRTIKLIRDGGLVDLAEHAAVTRFVELLTPVAEALGDVAGEQTMLVGLLTITINLGLERRGADETGEALRAALATLPTAVAALAIARAEASQPAGRA